MWICCGEYICKNHLRVVAAVLQIKNSRYRKENQMPFIDKTINRMIKWESVDISISEMVDLIQREILEKSSGSELSKLKKGMCKTWVLAVGSGFGLRYYPTSSSPVRLCCRFNGLTHQLQQISLLDSINKTEYFIPSGKTSCVKLQRAVLRRLAKYSYDEADGVQGFGSSGKYLNPTRAKRSAKKIGLRILALLAAAAMLLVILNLPPINKLLFNRPLEDTPQWVSTVQNGYLGEFTDMTVYELLGNYRAYYDNEIWDGGTTDDGDRITEVRFTNSQALESATIQFNMLNDDVFYVSAYVDTEMPDAQRSDVIYALTASYYSGIALEYLGDNEKTTQLNALLREVDASEILYGASASFTGDRAMLYQMRNDVLLGLTAAEVLEYYGLAIVDPPKDDFIEETQSDVVLTMEPMESTPDIQFAYFTADELLMDMDQNILRASQKYKDMYLILTGKVSEFYSDGQIFLMGSTSYESFQTISCVIADEGQIADLMNASVGDIITIQCKVTQVDQLTGYQVEMISVEEIAPNPDTQPETTEGLNPPGPLTGSVLRSSGGLKVRSGPGTNHAEVRRLEPGETVTIYEQQNVDGRYWGNIGDGWVCMDYIVYGIDTSVEPNNLQNPPDTSREARKLEYIGEWVSDDGYYCMAITQNGNGVNISAECILGPENRITWQMFGEYDEHCAIRYWNGICKNYEDGVETVWYTSGEGAIVLNGSRLSWHESMEGSGDFMTFSRAGAHAPNPPYMNAGN